MALTAKFAYLQTRLQARHGIRNDAVAWRRLQGSVDFANYLQLAQQTALRPWVMSLHPAQDSGEIEQTLRRQFRDHIEEVAGWAPAPWRPAIRWARRLPDLPALRHLLAGKPAPSGCAMTRNCVPLPASILPSGWMPCGSQTAGC